MKRSVDIVVNDKNAGKTIGRIKGEIKALNAQIGNLVPGTEAYAKKLEELKGRTKILKEHNQAVRGISKANKKWSFSLKGLLGQMNPITSITTAVVAGIAGIGAGIVAIDKVSQAFRKLRGEIASTAGLEGQALDDATVRVKAIADTYGEDIGRIRSAANAISKEFDISFTESLDKLNSAFLSGANGNGELLDNAIEYSTQIATAGGNIDSLLNIVDSGVKDGVFSDKAIDSVKEFNLRIREGTNATREAVEDLIGVTESDELFQGVTTGAVTSLEAMQQISTALNDVNVSASLSQRVVADVFGSAGEDAGLKFLKSLKDINGTIESRIDLGNTLTTAQKEQYKANEALAEAQNELSKTFVDSGDAFRVFWTDLKTGSIKAFSGIIKFVAPLAEMFRNLFSEIRQLDFEGVTLQLAEFMFALNPFAGSMRDAINEAQRFDDLTDSVVDGIKEEAAQVDVLVSALKENKEALESKNLTSEEEIELNNQNKSIIDKLKSTYPELTKNVDLQSASLGELDKVQKNITENLVDQQKEIVKAAEQERILQEIIKTSVDLSRQRVKEANRSAITNFMANIFADNSEDLEEQLEKLKTQLEQLPEIFEQVDNTIDGMNINYGATFNVTQQLVKESRKTLEDLQSDRMRIVMSGNKAELKAIDTQIEAQKSLQASASKDREEQLNKVLGKTEEIEKQKTTVISAETAKQTEERKKQEQAAIKSATKTLSQLEKLKASFAGLQDDFDFNDGLIGLSDQAKEEAKLERNIAQKYEKEMAGAKELAEGRGKIAEDARLLLADLELQKTEEIEQGKLRIAERYKEIALKKNNSISERDTEQRLKIAKARADMEVLLAEESSKEQVEARKKALEADQLLQLNAIQSQFDNKLLSEVNFNSQKELLELQHQQRLDDIDKNFTDHKKQRVLELSQSRFDLFNEGLGILMEFSNLSTERTLSNIDKEKDAKITALDTALKANKMSQDKYEARKHAIEEGFEQKRREVKTQQFIRERSASALQATINTAVAVTKLLANPPAAIAAGVAGAAQVALILAKPVPQFMAGGFHNVVGAEDGKTYRARYTGSHPGGMLPSVPNLVLASEKGPEYYVPNHLLSNPLVAGYVDIIESFRTGRQMYNGGYDRSTELSQSSQSVSSASSLVPLLEKLNSTLSSLESKGVSAYISDSSVRELDDRTSFLREVAGD